MTNPEKLPPTLGPARRIFKDYEQLERALQETEEQWTEEFIKRLSYAVADMGNQK
jgi:hypothetical protein